MKNLSIEEKLTAAYSLHTSADVMAELSSDSDWRVRVRVAGNPNTPADILIKLANNQEWCVRLIVAKNPNTSADILTKLASDINWRVKEAAEKIILTWIGVEN